MSVLAYACLTSTEDRIEHWIPCNWSYRQLWATVWLLGTEPRSSSRAANALNRWTVSSPVFKILIDEEQSKELFHAMKLTYIGNSVSVSLIFIYICFHSIHECYHCTVRVSCLQLSPDKVLSLTVACKSDMTTTCVLNSIYDTTLWHLIFSVAVWHPVTQKGGISGVVGHWGPKYYGILPVYLITP